ncbi:GFA family protein [Bosea sp. (in: a-proteobacteria)]|uniref:GFA family protein n=1 Tax=Bosea sp. (in: a-proteobacteria) TaxID=1871050 RepID=UPI003FA608A9
MGEAARVSGGCLCGAVRYTAVPEKPEMDVCHCRMCRRWSGGVFMSVPCHDLKVADEKALGRYASSEWAERLFCRDCGTSLFWRFQGGESGHVAIAYQSFDDLPPVSFAEEIFIDEKPALYAFAGERPRKTGEQVIAEFAAKQAG